MGGRKPKNMTIQRGRVVGVIEHEKVGEFLFAQFARHIGKREQAVWHGGEGEKLRVSVPHHHVQSEMIARERQRGRCAVQDRRGERPAQRRPYGIAELFPGGEQHARIRPRRRLAARHADPGEHVLAIVEPQIRRDHRAARAPPGLAVELVLGRHPHQDVGQARSLAANDHGGTVGTVWAQRIRRPFELVPADGPAVEAQQSGNSAHGKRDLSISSAAELREAREAARGSAADNDVVADLDPGVGGQRGARSPATPRQSRLAMPRRRNMACAASARGRHSALIHGLVPRVSIAHAIQLASSTAKRWMRRGGRSAQANRRAGGRTRTASRARTSMTAASRK